MPLCICKAECLASSSQTLSHLSAHLSPNPSSSLLSLSSLPFSLDWAISAKPLIFNSSPIADNIPRVCTSGAVGNFSGASSGMVFLAADGMTTLHKWSNKCWALWESVWAHWHAVHRHRVEALHSYTHPTWLRFWGSGSLVDSKWCHYVMVEADSHLKLLPTSILDINKVFWHIDMLSIVIW